MKSKRLIILFLSFLIIFNLSFTSTYAYANTSAYSSIGASFGFGSVVLDTVGGSAVVAAAPYVAAFAVTAISLGVIYKNRQEIITGLQGAYNYAKEKGQNFLDSFSIDGSNVSVGNQALESIRGYTGEVIENPTLINGEGFLGSGTLKRGQSTVVPFTVPKGFITAYKMTWSSSYNPYYTYFEIGGSNFQYDFLRGSTKTYYIYCDMTLGYLRYTISANKAVDMSNANLNYWTKMPSITNQDGKYSLRNSISSDAPDAHWTMQTYTGDSVGVLDGVDSDVSFKNPSLNPTSDISISIPTSGDIGFDDFVGEDWKNIINTFPIQNVGATDIPTVPDVPSVPDVDIPSTGIGGWLEKIWETVKGIPGAIVGGLTGFLQGILDGIGEIATSIGKIGTFILDGLKELFISLIIPTKAIEYWNDTLVPTFMGKFPIIDQIKSLAWSTSNNNRLSFKFTYKNNTESITLPDFFEDNVSIFRNLFKYFVYVLTMLGVVKIVRPRFTVGTR